MIGGVGVGMYSLGVVWIDMSVWNVPVSPH